MYSKLGQPFDKDRKQNKGKTEKKCQKFKINQKLCLSQVMSGKMI